MTETRVTHTAPSQRTPRPTSKPQKLEEKLGADSPSEPPEGITVDALISEFRSPKPVRQ